MRNLCSQVITKIILEKICHGLNEKVVTATSILEDSSWEVNLSKN